MSIFASMLGRRRITQVMAILLFFVVPLLNIFRVDITTGQFYLWGRVFPLGAVNPVGIPIIVIVLVAFILGFLFVLLPSINLLAERGFCGWVCPQTLLSEIGELSGVAAWKHHLFPGKAGKLTRGLRLPVWLRVPLGAAMALLMAYGFTSYLVGPGKILPSLTSAGAPSVIFWLAALVWAFNFFFLGHLFCYVCPFGNFYQMIWTWLSGLIAKGVPALGSGLRVQILRGKMEDCSRCDACLKACPMNVPILSGKPSPACISCGACIDACKVMLAPQGKAPVLGFASAYHAQKSRGETRADPSVWPRVIMAAIGTILAIGVSMTPLLVGKEVILNTTSASSTIVGHRAELSLVLNLQNFRGSTLRGRVVLSGMSPGAVAEAHPEELVVPPGGKELFTVFVSGSLVVKVSIVDQLTRKVLVPPTTIM